MRRIAALLILALILPGCIDIPPESKGLIMFFVVLLSVNIVLQVVVIALLAFYFLPFTRPRRRGRKSKG